MTTFFRRARLIAAGALLAGGAVSFDACYWTPWGTLITAEESWVTAAAGSTSPYGRLFERVPLCHHDDDA
jgi:hypothetical protein